MSNKPPASQSPNSAIAAFVAKAKALEHLPAQTSVHRLIFGLDATASREATWDQASHIQHGMFESVAKQQRLAIQLCYYRGFRELKASHFVSDADDLRRLMQAVRCQGGHTQIQRFLKHALRQHQQSAIKAVIFIGDAIEESVDDLCALAGTFGLRQVPLFLFHEGGDQGVGNAFRSMAKLSGGAYLPFDLTSPNELRQLLAGVAAYATGGHTALSALRQHQPRLQRLSEQLTSE